MSDLTQILVNSSGAVVVCFIAFSFFSKLIKMNNEERQSYSLERQNTVSKFTETINEYMKDSLKVKQELVMRLQEFSDASHEQRLASEKQTAVIDHLSDIIKKMYDELYKKHKQKAAS